jgi:hypothetical protein
MLGREGRRLFDGTPEGFPRTGPDGNGAPSSLLATCPGCGDVVVDVVETRVRRGPEAESCWYAFICPSCARRIQVTAPGHLVAVLVCLGAVEEPEVPELLELRDGPPLTLDDLIDLALTLDSPDAVAGLTERP